MTQATPLTIRKVEGSSREVYGRTLTPVAQVLSFVRHKGTIRESAVEGAGWGLAWSKPCEIVEERDGEVRVLPIPDVTGTAVRQMALVALAVPMLAMALVLLARWLRDR